MTHKQFFKGENKLLERTEKEYDKFQATARKEVADCKKGKPYKY